MSTFVLASPSYGSIDPRSSKSLRVALANAHARGHQMVADASPERQLITPARNNVALSAVRAAKKLKADGIVWVDDDIVVPQDGISRLLMYEKDLISGVYCQRTAPHWPLIALFREESFAWLSVFPKDSLIKVDGFGFGFCFTSMNLLKVMLDRVPEIAGNGWFEYRDTSIKCPSCQHVIPRGFSEDLHFCRQAAAAGFQAWADTTILCGHLGEPEVITLEHHERWREESGFEGKDITEGTAEGSPKEEILD